MRSSKAALFALSIVTAGLYFSPSQSHAASLRAAMSAAEFEGHGKLVGTATLADHGPGSRLRLDYSSLPEGRYSVELHQGSSCGISYAEGSGPEGATLRPLLAGQAGAQIAISDKPLPELVAAKSGSGRAMVDLPELPDAANYRGRTLLLRGERLLCGQLR